MGHFARLQLVSRITYYFGWIALVCGGIVHVNIGRALFANLGFSQRNLFEISVVCFLICAASELRALTATENAVPSIVKRQVAA
jgi:hypothetical protein